jgi:hypothetical protein
VLQNQEMAFWVSLGNEKSLPLHQHLVMHIQKLLAARDFSVFK